MENDKSISVRGYEHRDMGVRFILLFGAGLLVLLVITHVLLLWLYSRLDAQRVAEVPRSLVDVSPIGQEPPLQIAPSRDLAEMRAAEDRALNSYEWVDRSQGIVRMPIDAAMKAIAERGLPVRPAATQENENEK